LWSRQSSAEPPVTWRAALRENWSYGRWLVGGAVLFSVSSQVQMFLVAGALGLGAAGVLRAMQIPSLMMNQVVVASGLLILPTLSRDFGRGVIKAMRHKAVLVSVALTAVTLCFAALITVEAPRVEHLFYGAKYVADVRLMPILALIPVASGASTGFSMALRASQKPRFDLVSNLIAAPVAIVSALVFMRYWGLAGAAASMLLSFIVLCAITIVFFWRDAARERAVADAPQGMWR
jgi:O-antigen/teichoic acid export membrane protein